MSALAAEVIDPEFVAALAASGCDTDLLSVQSTFESLVDWPDEAPIEEFETSTSAERRALLALVCKVLIESEDTTVMPREMVRLIVDRAHDLNGITYAEGARAVLRCPAIFGNLDKEFYP